MQSACGAAGPNNIALWGATNYMAPVNCNRFFSFDWFIVFFEGFVWLLLALFVLPRIVHKFRSGLIAFLAIATTLLMLACNTWVRVISYDDTISGTFVRRARVAFAGALVAAVANLILIFLIGLHDEKNLDRTGEKKTYTEAPCPPGMVPATTTTTTTGTRPGATYGETAV